MVVEVDGVATKTLLEKIEALPPEKKAQVEDFVEFLAHRQPSHGAANPQAQPPILPADLVKQINAGREALLREHGPFDTDEILRNLRENGGR